MSEELKIKSFEQEITQFEKEPLLGAGNETLHESAESTNNLTAAEALKLVAEANEDSKSETPLEKLKSIQNEPEHQVNATISSEVKRNTARREIKNLRKQESLPDRTLSRIIHQPVVRAISEGASKTVSRPSGLLGGGLLAFLGSGSYLILAKYMHFNYNYSVSLALFVAGFLIGLCLELLVYVLTASHRQGD
jgi:hypothetical protein